VPAPAATNHVRMREDELRLPTIRPLECFQLILAQDHSARRGVGSPVTGIAILHQLFRQL